MDGYEERLNMFLRLQDEMPNEGDLEELERMADEIEIN